MVQQVFELVISRIEFRFKNQLLIGIQDQVLGPLLSITNPRTDERISFVGGIRGTSELEARVERGEAAAAFSLPAVTPDQLLAVADAGLIMPPKSTWFEPKLRSGLLTYLLENQS